MQAGLDKARQDLGKDRPDRNGDRRFDRGAFENTVVNDIASATGVDAAKVRSALQGLRPTAGAPRPRPRRRARRHPPEARDRPRRDDRAARTTAFQKVATQRDAFATELAQKLNIDVAEGQGRPAGRARPASPSDSGIAGHHG